MKSIQVFLLSSSNIILYFFVFHAHLCIEYIDSNCSGKVLCLAFVGILFKRLFYRAWQFWVGRFFEGAFVS